MDYEKRYKEALERAKQFSEKPLLEDSAGIVEYIFPELKESEDERVREGIIKYLSWIKDRDGSYMPNNIPFDDMIAWLEKQGEQKPFDYEHATIQQRDFAPKFDSPVLSNSSNIGNPEDLASAAVKYSQDKHPRVQTAMAFTAGAEWMQQRLQPLPEKLG